MLRKCNSNLHFANRYATFVRESTNAVNSPALRAICNKFIDNPRLPPLSLEDLVSIHRELSPSSPERDRNSLVHSVNRMLEEISRHSVLKAFFRVMRVMRPSRFSPKKRDTEDLWLLPAWNGPDALLLVTCSQLTRFKQTVEDLSSQVCFQNCLLLFEHV